ncbi:MAG TPA: Rieske (2Fe-2S) protein [Cyclobacteriaceae bacterium]
MENLEDNKVPGWKRDFPVRQDEATHISRREFAKFLGLLSGSLALGNGAIVVKSIAFPGEAPEGEHYVCEEAQVPVGEMRQFVLERGNKTIPYILIHLDDNEWRSFEQKCTHLSCAVRYRSDLDQIECPCHKGFFDSRTGEPLQGPPPRPLPALKVVVRGGKVYVYATPTENIARI